MLTKILNHYALILILLLALVIRGWAIWSTPALNPDEAALGYNAYSLLETGHDEHGASWPLHFKSFGDYKPGGYVYLALPFVKVLGLTPLAVRLPNLILSVLTIFVLYKLIHLLTKNNNLALLSAFVLTISPWHIHFSRGAWESSAALSFITFGVYFFYKFLDSKQVKFFNFFILSLVVSLYIYHSARLVAPLLALSLVITNFSTIYDLRSKIYLPIIFGILICIPVAFSFLHNGGAARFGGVGITADQGPVWRSNELLNQHNNVKLINRVMHNKRVLYAISWAQKYTSHFDFNFLFVSGDEVPRSRVPDMGQMYLLELPFLLLGLIFLFSSTIYRLRSKIFIISFLLIAPIASSLTFQAPSALRALPMTIPLSILVALGLYQSCKLLSKNKLLYSSFAFLVSSFYIFSFFYYLDAYFVHYPQRYPYAWQYGFPQAVALTQANYDKYDHIYVTNKYDQPYILFLFYSKYDPRLIQNEISLTPPDQYGFSTVTHFGKYTFGKIDWPTIPANSLVLASDEPVPVTPASVINFPNTQPAFKIYTK